MSDSAEQKREYARLSLLYGHLSRDQITELVDKDHADESEELRKVIVDSICQILHPLDDDSDSDSSDSDVDPGNPGLGLSALFPPTEFWKRPELLRAAMILSTRLKNPPPLGQEGVDYSSIAMIATDGAINDYPELLDRLIELKYPLDEIVGDTTPLCAAVKAKNPKVVEKLLTAGVDPNRFDGKALYIAVYHHPELVDQLLAAGADPTIDDMNSLRQLLGFDRFDRELWEKLTAKLGSAVDPPPAMLLRAAFNSVDPTREAYRMLLEKFKPEDDFTLHDLSYSDFDWPEVAIADLPELIERFKLDLNSLDEGRTPLEECVKYGNYRAAGALIDLGVDPTVGNPSLLNDYLLPPDKGNPNRRIDLDFLARLTGGDLLSRVNDSGFPPLFVALWRNQPQFFNDGWVDMSREERLGTKQPQPVAEVIALVDRLIELGADFFETVNGWNLLTFATSIDVAGELLIHLVGKYSLPPIYTLEPTPELKTPSTENILMPKLFEIRSFVETVDVNRLRWLVENGVPIDTVGPTGRTALELALDRNSETAVAALLSVGADPRKGEFLTRILDHPMHRRLINRQIKNEHWNRLQATLKKCHRVVDQANCVICLDEDAPRPIIFTPCGHRAVCLGCIDRIDGRCPLCRQRIIGTLFSPEPTPQVVTEKPVEKKREVDDENDEGVIRKKRRTS